MFRLEAEVDKERRALISERLHGSNAARSPVMRALRGTPADEEVPLHVFALDDSGEVVGGLIGYTWAHWLHVDLLWIDERQRGSGLGSALMSRAEKIARDERHCVHARVETWDFQAPGFYQKLGYTIVGTVEEYPPGATDYLLVKPLTGG
ncbi:GNAT family N-acetyltransferase [Streptomyces sp. NPDC004647]|uniref:GNAT family N-acetyltransferase n=1 Tax=Streptomyces sp. NPDC004647 TaxID=3154671 RepID=UPI0033B97A8C